MKWVYETSRRLGVVGIRFVGCWRSGLLVLLASATMTASAADWPLFRGNSAQTGFINEPLAMNYTLTWTYRTGRMCTSPVVANGIAVVGSGDGKVHAVNLKDGSARWTFDLGAEIEGSPAIHNGQVVIGSTEGKVVCLSLTDGALRWETKAGDKISGAVTIYSTNETTRVLVGSYDNNVYCFELVDGKKVWAYETQSYVNGTPAITTLNQEAVAVVGGCDAKLHVIKLADGKAIREIEVSAYVASSLACNNGQAITGHYGNEVISAELATGATLWTYKEKNFPFFSSPAVSAAEVVIGGRDRRLHCIDRTTGKVRWVFAARGNVDGSPIIGGNHTLVGSDDGRIYLIDLATGKEAWSYEIGDKISGSPAVVGKQFLVGCDDGGLYAFTAVTKESP